MTKTAALEWIRKTRVVPVVRATSAEEALSVVTALVQAGIDIVEITMTVPGAVEVIRETATKFGRVVLIGAGTVTDAETAKRCVEAGANFIVSPIVDLPTIETCKSMDVAMAAGALSPTEVFSAWSAGADIVKIFPCDAAGGAKYIKSLKGPFPQIPLMPTGGVTIENAPGLLAAGADAVGVGGNLVDLRLLGENREEFVENARQFLYAVSVGD